MRGRDDLVTKNVGLNVPILQQRFGSDGRSKTKALCAYRTETSSFSVGNLCWRPGFAIVFFSKHHENTTNLVQNYSNRYKLVIPGFVHGGGSTVTLADVSLLHGAPAWRGYPA